MGICEFVFSLVLALFLLLWFSHLCLFGQYQLGLWL